MTKLFAHTITLTAIILLTSCGKSEQEIKEEKQKVTEQKEKTLESANEKSISDLALKYKAVTGWDTLNLWTYHFQEMFIDSSKLINFEGEIKDITKTDSTFILKVHNTNWSSDKNYIAEITTNSKQLQQILNLLKSKKHSGDGSFIFKVSKIISATPEIKSDLKLDGEDSYSYLDYNFDANLIIFKGELIDCYLNEISNDSEE